MQHRQSHYDVTNRIQVSDPRAVMREVTRLLEDLYPDADLRPVETAFDTFTRMYSGTQPGYHGCDTWYHDAQHSLDTTLAMARLIDGHERSALRSARLGLRRAVVGIISALFHDVGYIRRTEESRVPNGAAFTLCHVTRSGEFLADFLPTVGYRREARLAKHMVHYTGYEKPLAAVRVRQPKDRRLGFLLGTADLIAQMADREYPEKCRSFLFHEFQACGIAGKRRRGKPKPLYDSPEDLLRKTPEFARKLFKERLDGYFEGAYHLIEDHFGGVNPYLAEIRRHIDYIRQAVETDDYDRLRRHPHAVNAHALRHLSGIRIANAGGSRVRLRGQRTRRARIRPSEFVPA